MPNAINNNAPTLANRIAADAKEAGMGPDVLRTLGQLLLERSQGNSELSFFPSIREHMETLGSGIRMAAEELAANTTPDPLVDNGVTA